MEAQSSIRRGNNFMYVLNSASYVLDVGNAMGSNAAPGSVLFVGIGVLGQDNNNFYWDDTHKRFWIGRARNTPPSPLYQFTLDNHTANESLIQFTNTTTGNGASAGTLFGYDASSNFILNLKTAGFYELQYQDNNRQILTGLDHTVLSGDGTGVDGGTFHIGTGNSDVGNGGTVEIFTGNGGSAAGDIYMKTGSGGGARGFVIFDGNIQFFNSAIEVTGGGTPLFGTNCPASTLTAPYKWIKVLLSDNSVTYIPCWK